MKIYKADKYSLKQLSLVLCLIGGLTGSGCLQSDVPKISELAIAITQPKFSGAISKIFTSPSHTFLLSGECHLKSQAIQYSLDGQSTWAVAASDCLSGTFAISVPVALTQAVYVRAKRSATSYTASSYALINFTMPPTSPFLTAVSASLTETETAANGMQSTLNTMTNSEMTSAGHILHSQPIGISYGQ